MFSQAVEAPPPVLAAAEEAPSIDSPLVASPEAISSLETIQALIQANLDAQQELRNEFKSADASSLSGVQQQLDELTADLKQLRKSLEQSAIGSVDTSVFNEEEAGFDWQVELSQILMPIVDNLKALTEKPRRISSLLTSVERLSKQREAIVMAMENIDAELEAIGQPDLQASLGSIRKSWKRRLSDNDQKTKLAKLQLNELQNSDTKWWNSAKSGLLEFIKGRGLTLFLAFCFAVVVWHGLRGLFNLILTKRAFADHPDFRTRKRLAQYVFRAVSFMIVLVVVVAVFYVRGDMLLLGLAIIAVVGLALGLRQAVPRFYHEARLLLDLGSIRENERVMYNGLPWQVVSLNVHSVLRNPELTGVVRLPLKQMGELVSRPAGKEPWFPASKNDYLLLDNGLFRQVVRLTPEVIELQSGGGSITSVPSNEFYRWTFENLSRGETYAIPAVFGIDYQLQDISLSTVAPRLREAIEYAIMHSDYKQSLKQVQVEFKAAGASSLDFWIYVTMQSSAVTGLFKIERMIQQACVKVCTEENWGIPFPHMTVQQLPASAPPAPPPPAI
ncbi:mechanosensitive ion channel domain-containing protein [Granulosicoccus antarcticus]|uniref:mechanosensitive ion channel domain-containing protein n=1 Tax=Granulosicoccus antarcticus TaxID=437505 RepID=UPI0012FD5153|nr:mechanosensitive ion channel domain-containing protein [Granulosicoccus antarcticus]